MSEVTVVNVFAAAEGGGNPTPIVLDASGYDEARMLQVTRSYGLESTFVFPPTDPGEADFRFRFFVPRHEMNMCGHATVGTLWLLRKVGRFTGARVIASAVRCREGAIRASWPSANDWRMTGVELLSRTVAESATSSPRPHRYTESCGSGWAESTPNREELSREDTFRASSLQPLRDPTACPGRAIFLETRPAAGAERMQLRILPEEEGRRYVSEYRMVDASHRPTGL